MYCYLTAPVWTYIRVWSIGIYTLDTKYACVMLNIHSEAISGYNVSRIFCRRVHDAMCRLVHSSSVYSLLLVELSLKLGSC